jgi:hypothetical protein
MWLLYLRFDDQGEAKIMHLQCTNRKEIQQVLTMARERGLTSTSNLKEYAYFYASGPIYNKGASHNCDLYTTASFGDEWRQGLLRDWSRMGDAVSLN